MTWWVIVNPWSGRRGEVERRARAALDAAGIDHELRVSASERDVAVLVREGRGSGATRFAAVGGDGTANLVLNGMMERPWEERPTLAILPAGSGSDFIRTFGLPRRMEEAAVHLASDDVYTSDIGTISGTFGTRYFLNAANIGVTAASVVSGRRLPRWIGGTRYTIGFWLSLHHFGGKPVIVEAGPRVFDGPSLAIVIANGQFFGGGLNIAPRATVVDGRFDIQVFSGPRRNAFTVMPKVVSGNHLAHKAVKRFVAASVRVECDPAWPVEADGEVLGTGSITAEVIPAAIDFKI